MRVAHDRRGGFTLIEMLIVMGIILTLAGLLLAAIFKVQGFTSLVSANHDISQLSIALESFKTKFGFYPPSRIKLCETFAGYGGDPPPDQLGQDSVYYLTKMFPRIKDSTSKWNTSFIDWDGNGSLSAPVILEGDQCLVFFLGGIPTPPPTPVVNVIPGCLGFNNSPIDPIPSSTSKIGPFYEFKTGRLIYVQQPSAAPGFPYNGIASPSGLIYPNRSTAHFSYLDSYGTNVYAYFSSYKAENGYNRYFDSNSAPGNLNFYPYSDCLLLWVLQPLNTPPAGQQVPQLGGIWPYAEAIFPDPASPPPHGPGSSWRYLKPNSFQIVCAGADGQFGWGSIRTLGPAWTPASAGDVYHSTPPPPSSTSFGADDVANFYERALGIATSN